MEGKNPIINSVFRCFGDGDFGARAAGLTATDQPPLPHKKPSYELWGGVFSTISIDVYKQLAHRRKDMDNS